MVKISDMKIYVNPLKAIREHEEPRGERRLVPSALNFLYAARTLRCESGSMSRGIIYLPSLSIYPVRLSGLMRVLL